MTSLALPRPADAPAIARDRLMVAIAALLCALVAAAAGHRLAAAGHLLPPGTNPWLALHLLSVIPAVPLGAYVLVRRKGDRTHKLLGRVWVGLMLSTALSSFGLHYSNGGFSWIHLLSIVTLVSLPRSIWMAARGNIRVHMRGMRTVYLALAIAGLASFVPGRMLGTWLFG